MSTTWAASLLQTHITVSAVTRELPGNIPYTAKRAFIREFQDSWEQHALMCFDRVHETFKGTLTDLVRDRFNRFSNLKAVIA